jgi:hypothetical protein
MDNFQGGEGMGEDSLMHQIAYLISDGFKKEEPIIQTALSILKSLPRLIRGGSVDLNNPTTFIGLLLPVLKGFVQETQQNQVHENEGMGEDPQDNDKAPQSTKMKRLQIAATILLLTTFMPKVTAAVLQRIYETVMPLLQQSFKLLSRDDEAGKHIATATRHLLQAFSADQWVRSQVPKPLMQFFFECLVSDGDETRRVAVRTLNSTLNALGDSRTLFARPVFEMAQITLRDYESSKKRAINVITALNSSIKSLPFDTVANAVPIVLRILRDTVENPAASDLVTHGFLFLDVRFLTFPS